MTNLDPTWNSNLRTTRRIRRPAPDDIHLDAIDKLVARPLVCARIRLHNLMAHEILSRCDAGWDGDVPFECLVCEFLSRPLGLGAVFFDLEPDFS